MGDRGAWADAGIFGHLVDCLGVAEPPAARVAPPVKPRLLVPGFGGLSGMARNGAALH